MISIRKFCLVASLLTMFPSTYHAMEPVGVAILISATIGVIAYGHSGISPEEIFSNDRCKELADLFKERSEIIQEYIDGGYKISMINYVFDFLREKLKEHHTAPPCMSLLTKGDASTVTRLLKIEVEDLKKKLVELKATNAPRNLADSTPNFLKQAQLEHLLALRIAGLAQFPSQLAPSHINNASDDQNQTQLAALLNADRVQSLNQEVLSLLTFWYELVGKNAGNNSNNNSNNNNDSRTANILPLLEILKIKAKALQGLSESSANSNSNNSNNNNDMESGAQPSTNQMSAEKRQLADHLHQEMRQLFNYWVPLYQQFQNQHPIQQEKEIFYEDEDFVGTIPAEFHNIMQKLKGGDYTDSKAILLWGPPGTGKTSLARLIRKIVGNDAFVEGNPSRFIDTYVGTGPKSVEDCYARAKAYLAKNPGKKAVVFLDELDSLGNKSRLSGHHNEGFSTLSQLGTQIDGLNSNKNIITIAATNYTGLMDDALLNRFLSISVLRPTSKTIEAVLKFHIRAGCNNDKRFLQNPSLSLKEILNVAEELDHRELKRAVEKAFLIAQNSGTFTLTSEYLKKAILNVRKDRKEDLSYISEHPLVTFKDVAGSIPEEMVFLVSLIKDSKHNISGDDTYGNLPLPKGILLLGPPGTGKTLLARAFAGEINNGTSGGFFLANATQFVTGSSASGVKNIEKLFNMASSYMESTSKIAIVFIDEFDLIGSRKHGYGEKEAAIATFLTKMDGFEQSSNLIIFAATNNAQDIDEALKRPGRFDWTVEVPLPHLKSREAILQFYLKEIPSHLLDRNISVSELLQSLARMTEGFSNADLKQLITEARYVSLMERAPVISHAHFQKAFERLVRKKNSDRKNCLQQTKSATVTNQT